MEKNNESYELALEVIESRIKSIEDKLFGQNKPNQIPAQHLIDQMLQIDSKLRELTAGKERFNNCHQKLNENKKWFEPDYIESSMSSATSKLEEVLAREDDINKQTQQFDKIKLLEKNIDSPQIRECDSLRPHLEKIQIIALDQNQQAQQFDQKIQHLINEYNRWIVNVKSQLANWDEILKKAEREKRDKRKGKFEFD